MDQKDNLKDQATARLAVGLAFAEIRDNNIFSTHKDARESRWKLVCGGGAEHGWPRTCLVWNSTPLKCSIYQIVFSA